MMRRIPNVNLREIIRDKGFDRLFVYQLRRGTFSTRASHITRNVAKRFLLKLGKAARSQREPRPRVIEEVTSFLAEHSFKSIEWTGRKIIAYTEKDHVLGRYESTAENQGPYKAPLRKLHLLCAIEPPFFYGDARV